MGLKCEHGRQRSICRQCGGVGICKHNRRRLDCRFCDPKSWAKKIVSAALYRDRNIKNISPEKVLSLMTSKCVLCGEALDWAKIPSPHLHHNHRDGKIVGFAHGSCNRLEGFILSFSLRIRKRFLRKYL
jgi:Recombination endonuclease VII